MIFHIAKLMLLLFVSSSLSITLAALMFFASVNYGNILYFSSLIWILALAFLMKKKLDLRLVFLLCFGTNSILLVAIALAKFQVIHEVLKNSSTDGDLEFFVYFLSLFFMVTICGFIMFRRLKADEK